MSDAASSSAPDSRNLAAELRLRPERPVVTRLSRKVLMGLAAIMVTAVCGALIWALYEGKNKAGSGSELYTTENKTTPDGLSGLPRDYIGIPSSIWPSAATSVPALGPPLPGDLGRPLLAAQGLPVSMPASVDAERQRLLQESEAARTSHIFASTSAAERSPVSNSIAAVVDQKTPPQSGQTEPLPPLDPDSLTNMQDRKIAFANGPTDRKTVSSDRLANPPSPYIVQAGAVIPAALITGIRSDLPGQVTAQVTQNVFDSPTGRFLLIPQGSRLIGLYDSQISFGQDRVMLAWTRLIMRNGRSIVLERQPGADTQGFAGLEDETDNHWGRLLMAAALSTVLGVGAELGSTSGDSAIVTALRRGSTDSLNQTGQQVVRRNLNIQPTITIRPGFPVRVIVNRDLVLAPYQS